MLRTGMLIACVVLWAGTPVEAAVLGGTVKDSGTEAPLARADVLAFGGGELLRTVTDADGVYAFEVDPGEWILNASAFGYGTTYLTTTVDAGGAAGADLSLEARPRARVSGRVTRSDGAFPIGATIHVIDTPAAPAVVDALGDYGLDLPRDATYVLEARLNGMLAARAEVSLDGDATEDFELTPRLQECFESGGFDDLPWVMSGDAGWTIDTQYQLQGSACAGSGSILSSQQSTMSVALDLEAGAFAFWVRTSTEPDGDILTFRVDGEEAGAWSGLTPWTLVVHDLEAGHHELSWTYAKNTQLSAYADQVWVDVVGDPWHAETALAPTAIASALPQDHSERRSLVLSNPGELTLDVSVDTRNLAPNLKSGWPDAAGYRWSDSDDPDGPEFVWEDISGTGTELPVYSNFVATYSMPMFFDFYGENCTAVNISSSGWISFASNHNATNNQRLPSANLPNALVAPFWDSLVDGENSRMFMQFDPEGRRLLIQWQDMAHYFTPGLETFQVVLHQDGTILMRYLDVSEPTSCSVGIESWDGLTGQEVAYNEPYLRDGLAIRLDRRPAWLTVSPTFGHIPPGGSLELVVDFDAAGLGPDLYFGMIRLTTNDPTRPVAEISAQLLVSPATLVEPVPVPELSLSVAPNPFNPATEVRFELTEPGPCRLEIVDLQGRRVRTLVAERLPVGPHRAVWDGRGDDGKPQASGAYRAVLQAGEERLVKSLTLLQ